MMIEMKFEAWTGEEWLGVETFQTEDVVIALEKLRALHEIATHPDQEWQVRVIVTWKEIGAKDVGVGAEGGSPLFDIFSAKLIGVSRREGEPWRW